METSFKTYLSSVPFFFFFCLGYSPLITAIIVSPNIMYMRDFGIVNSTQAQYVFIMKKWVNEPAPQNSTDLCTTWGAIG